MPIWSDSSMFCINRLNLDQDHVLLILKPEQNTQNRTPNAKYRSLSAMYRVPLSSLQIQILYRTPDCNKITPAHMSIYLSCL
jgi:hypothetical protein